MKLKTITNICKGIAVTQAIVAPALMMVGHFTGRKMLRNIGAAWCGLIAIDTARTTCDAIDNVVKISELEEEVIDLETKIEYLEEEQES